MSKIVFENPPPKPKRWNARHAVTEQHAAIAEQLRSRRAEWAHIFTRDTSEAAGELGRRIKGGKLKGFQPAGSFEATARTVDGEHRVYARFVGRVLCAHGYVLGQDSCPGCDAAETVPHQPDPADVVTSDGRAMTLCRTCGQRPMRCPRPAPAGGEQA